MNLEKNSSILIRTALLGIALFIPFSIAGSNTAIGIGILGLILGLVSSPEQKERLKELRRDPIILAALLLVATGLVSALTSENLARGIKDWKAYWLFVIYVLAGYHPIDEKFRKSLFWTLFASATLSALVAVIQAAGGMDFLFIHIRAALRARSTLFIMTFAGIFCLLILFNFSVLLREKRAGTTFLILIAGILVQAVGFLFALSRGSWLAFFFGLLALVVILRRKKALVLGGVLVIVIASLTAFNPKLNARFKSTWENLRSPTDRSIKTRYVLWDISLDLIEEHPLMGIGMGDFSLEAERRLGGRFVKSTADAHNIYLHVLATRGIFGFIPFVLFWVVVLRSLARWERSSRHGDQFHRHIIAGVFAACVALLVGALTENNIDDSEIFIAFLFLLGYARSTQWVTRARADVGRSGES